MKRTFLSTTCAVIGALTLSFAAFAQTTPQLVRPDGSYPTVPLKKDVIVVKVVQNAPLNLQKAPSMKEGLKTNVERMAHWIDRAQHHPAMARYEHQHHH